ncbi:MAG: efflux RND transporter permease subunit [bacterium]|nr:MAG: efflux RND transporter permease subunit [bacterium]
MQDKSFFEMTTTRPVAITMIIMGILVFGWISFSQLSLNLMPDISYPSLTVRTEYPGTAPEEVETTVSRPIEEALGVVTNLVSISSVSKAGQSDVTLEYNWDVKMEDAVGEAREKLDQVFLPEDADKPIILRYDPSLDPIMRLALIGGSDLFYTRYVAEEQIKRELETVEGVAAVKVKGGFEEEIWVELNEQKITLMGLDIQSLRQRLSRENINLAGGNLKEGQTEYVVRTMNEFKTVNEIENLILRLDGGRELRLGDIGKVYRTHKEREIITRLNKIESVELEIYKEGSANIVEVAKRVKEKVFGTPQQQAYVNSLQQKTEKKPATTQNRQDSFRERLRQKQMTDYLNYSLPDNLELYLLTDQSIFIGNSIDEVKNTAIIGGILAVIVLFFFLNNLRTTLIVGLSIPISIVATFAPMKLFDVSLNIMSLGGLALGIGMLVDNSIVVSESIFRCREEGDAFIPSVVRGVKEVGAAVTASTLTTIAVFFPMVFVKGVAGQIFGDMALTVVFSLLASLGVALFFIPMLASRQIDFAQFSKFQSKPKDFFLHFESVKQLKEQWRFIRLRFRKSSLFMKIFFMTIIPFWILYLILRFIIFFILNIFSKILTAIILLVGFIFKIFTRGLQVILSKPLQIFMEIFNRGFQRIYNFYPLVIDWALNNKGKVIALSVFPFLLVVILILPNLGSELIPEVHQGEFYVELTLPIGTPVERTVELIEPVEKILNEIQQVERSATVAGVDLTKISDREAGEHTAIITTKLKPTRNPIKTEERVIQDVRYQLKNIVGIEYKISRPVLFSFKTPIEVEIKGYNLQDLAQASRETVQAISEIDGVYDVKTNLQTGNPEVQIIYDREKLAYYNLNILDVANIVRNKVRGDIATQFKQEDRRIDVRVKIRESDKETIQQLKRLNINPEGEIPIPLETVANISIKEGPSEIRRINQQRSAVIMANIAGRDLFSVSSDIFQKLRFIDWPSDFSFEITGQNKEMEVSLGSLQLALLLAIFMVYIVMASQFESFLHPFVILFTVPLALIGVAIVLFIIGIPLNIMVFLGLIMLAGIVVNNAIVLVDYINQLRKKGLSKLDAIRQAGQARLRPILMTSATTVLGLLPMAMGWGDGAEIRTPMAITVIAGLISATLLTLVVIPTVYAIFEKGD